MSTFTLKTYCGALTDVCVSAYTRFVAFDVQDERDGIRLRRNLTADDAIAVGEALVEAGREVQRRNPVTKTVCVEVPSGSVPSVRASALNVGGRVVSES